MLTPRVARFLLAAIVAALCACGDSPPADGNPDIGATRHTLSVSISGGGRGSVHSGESTCQDRCSWLLDDGARVTLSADAEPGSFFLGWSLACTGAGSCDVTVTRDLAVMATFDRRPTGKRLVVVRPTGSGSVRSDPAGIDCGSSCAGIFTDGAALTLTPTAASGWRFESWSGACTGPGACKLTLRADATVSATFAPIPRRMLTVTLEGTGSGRVRSTPEGIDCPDHCSSEFQEGTAVSLAVEAGADSTFAGWKGACSGDGDCSVTLGAEAAATAIFERDACAGLAPGDVGLATSVLLDKGERDWCDAGVSDGFGNVGLLFWSQTVPAGRMVIYAPDGTKRGELGSFFLHPPIAQLEGFEVVQGNRVDAPPAFREIEVAAYGPTGHVAGRTFVAAGPGQRLVAEDPLGGLVALDPASRSPTLAAYDAGAKLRWETTLSSAAQVHALGVDRAGSTLALSDGSDYGCRCLAGQWVDHDGHAGSRFQATGDLGAAASRFSFALDPRVGNGLFLRVTFENGPWRWALQFDSGATAGAAAPAWLAARGDKRMHMARGGRAYAIIDPPLQSVLECTQRIEVVATSGKSCGTVAFALSPLACRTQSISVGYDGTVIQQGSTETDGAGLRRTCFYRWWPGLLR